jgi:hypothetical protein
MKIDKSAASGEAQRCPRCDSPDPRKHPAMQFEGEVQECTHPWHTPWHAAPASPAPPQNWHHDQFRNERIMQGAWDRNGDRTPEYVASLVKQTALWMQGISVHNEMTNECCCDFSCCHKNLATPQEQRTERGLRQIQNWLTEPEANNGGN